MPSLRSADRLPTSPVGTANIISMLKNATSQIKSDGVSSDITIALQVTADVDAILPHWKEFIEAIRSSTNWENQFWAFHKMKLPQTMLDILQPVVVGRNIHTLGSRGNGSDIYPFICEILEKNSSIKRLTMKRKAKIGSRLVRALKNNGSLEELHLAEMKLDAENMLSNILNVSKSLTLRHLGLRWCTLGERGGEILSQFLKQNHGLERLSLSDVDITDADAAKLAEALAKNTNLRELSLVGKTRNRMTEIGRKALCAALFDTKSLESVANSNHTCFVQTVSRLPEPCPYEALLDGLNRNSDPKDNRKWKMLSVLYATRGRGIQNDSGSNIFHYYQRKKLVPDMLALISEESSEDSAEESTTNLPEMVKHIGLPKADDEASARR